MNVEQITVENWRGFRERHVFSFDPGLNLLVGENETGKSTIFEALWRAIFDRHTSTAAEIRDIQPKGTSLAPRASVVFTHAARRYRIDKRFLHKSTSELFEESSGKFRLIHEGDRADRAIVEMAGGTAAGKGVTREQRKGLSQALWYLQSESPLPESVWNNAVKEGLSGIIQTVASTPEEEGVCRLAEKEYDVIFTPTGSKIKGHTELYESENRVSELENELQLLRARNESLQARRNEIDNIIASINSIEEEIISANDARTEVQASTMEGERIAAAVEESEKDLERLETDHSNHLRSKSEIEERIRKSDELNKVLQSVQEELVQVEVKLRSLTIMKDEARRKWRDVSEPELKACESELTLLLALERRRKLEKDLARLKKHLERKHDIEIDIETHRGRLEKLNAPSEEEWNSYMEKQGRLRVAEAEVRSSSIRVSFRLRDKAATVTSEPSASSESGEYSVDRPTVFTIGGMGEVHIRGGGKSLEEARKEAEAARADVQAVLSRFSVSSADALSSLLEERLSEEKRLSDAEKLMEVLLSEENDAEGEYGRTEIGISEESSKLGAASSQLLEMGGQSIREAAEDLGRRKDALIRAIESGQWEEAESEAQLDALKEQQRALESKRSGVSAKLSSGSEENTKVLSIYGSYEALEKIVREKDGLLKELRNRVEGLKSDFQQKVLEPRKMLEGANELLKKLSDRKHSLEVRLAENRGQIDNAAGENLYSKIADTEAELAYLHGRVATLRRRAAGLKLLRNLLRLMKQERVSELTRPVSELVSEWFQEITGSVYREVEMNGELLPVGARKSDGNDLALGSLSHGTQEQIVVLVRLAIGVLTSGTERNLVVLDDRLVNADAARTRRLRHVLEEAAKKCQILFATCNETSYVGSSGRFIRIPGDGLPGQASPP